MWHQLCRLSELFAKNVPYLATAAQTMKYMYGAVCTNGRVFTGQRAPPGCTMLETDTLWYFYSVEKKVETRLI